MGTLVPVLLCWTLLLGSTAPQDIQGRTGQFCGTVIPGGKCEGCLAGEMVLEGNTCPGPTAPQVCSGPGGSYSLTFRYTGLSRPTEGSPRFQATAHLNDQPFFHYDSKSRKAQPLGPWSQVEGMEDWEKESQLQEAREEIFMVTLNDIIDYYKDRGEDAGSHTFQGMFGCEVRNNTFSGAFWKYGYDGQDFIEFNKELPAWVPLDPAAVNIKQKWEAEAVYPQRAKAYLEEECPSMLRRYLEHGGSPLDRQDPPLVVFTSQVNPEKMILKCLVYGFYPEETALRWTRGSEAQEWDSLGDVLPSGDGTYQTLAMVEVPTQYTIPYFCHVEHSSLAQPLTVVLKKAKKPQD